MTFSGLIALSVEISTIAVTPAFRQASAVLRVPITLVSTPSVGLASTIGTCFKAAAWKTRSGLSSAITWSRRVRSRTSPSTAARGKSGNRSLISRSMLYSRYSALSSSVIRAGEKPAICRTSSAPIEPPAPVTRTRRPSIRRRMMARSSFAWVRPSRSSMAIGRTSIPPRASSPIWFFAGPLAKSVRRGSRAMVMPAPSAMSSSRSIASRSSRRVRIRRCGLRS